MPDITRSYGRFIGLIVFFLEISMFVLHQTFKGKLMKIVSREARKEKLFSKKKLFSKEIFCSIRKILTILKFN